MLCSDHDIFQTFEGDNTVLMQQVRGGRKEGAKKGEYHGEAYILSPSPPGIKGCTPPPPSSFPQVSALLLKEYRNQFKGAPLTSSYRFLAQVRGGCGAVMGRTNCTLPPAAHILPLITSFRCPPSPPPNAQLLSRSISWSPLTSLPSTPLITY